MMRPFFVTYQEAVDWLFQQIPNFQKSGGTAYKPGLERIKNFCAYIGNPQEQIQSIHIAGTNGKGSVAHSMAAALQMHDLKVGIFTSPHISDFTERIKINGEFIPQDSVLSFLNEHHEYILNAQLSFFEVTTALAFEYFNFARVDVAIIETGMGGRLDSTNIILPLISIITQIGLDHQQFLGDSITLIASEKAGIIKSDTTVVIGKKQKGTSEVFRSKATEMRAKLIYAGHEKFTSDLIARYQNENLNTAFTALKCIQENFQLKEDVIRKGFESICQLTGFKGRFQKISDHPLVIMDAAHNEDGVSALVQEINQFEDREIALLYGASRDKAIQKILQLIPMNIPLYFCQFHSDRSLLINDFKTQSKSLDRQINTFHSPTAALEHLTNRNTEVIIIFGSFFLMDEVIRFFDKP